MVVGNRMSNPPDGRRNVLIYDDLSIPAGPVKTGPDGITSYRFLNKTIPDMDQSRISLNLVDGVGTLRANKSDLKLFGENNVLINNVNVVDEINKLRNDLTNLSNDAVKKSKAYFISSNRGNNGGGVLWMTDTGLGTNGTYGEGVPAFKQMIFREI